MSSAHKDWLEYRERMTWIFDIDGTIFRYGGAWNAATGAWHDDLLPETEAVWRTIPPEDTIILVTARRADDGIHGQSATEGFLRSKGLRWNHIIYGVGTGARVLFNDTKPDGRITAHAVPVPRDTGVRKSDIERFL